ncbi:MAG: hypothetical protein EYC69_06155 [Bacteroidetes bacterium]|nr:MAG: hypothetical protein EYC69_06155 [Bacteroidota bacterium]
MKKCLPYALAILAFVFVTWLYFMPLFQGKDLRQTDINNWKGMAQEILSTKEATGHMPLWTNSMFGGMPAYQISAVYGANLVQYIDKAIMFFPSPANFFFLYLIGFYFLLIVLGVDKRVAIMGAFAFAFSSYFIIILEAGHNTKAHAIGYMAPVVAGVLLTYRGRWMLGASIAGLALALELNTNHLQISYYLMLIVVSLAVAEFISALKEKRLPAFVKSSFLLLGMAALAVSTNITNIWATQEYAKYSTRGPSELTINEENKTSGLDRDYITDWSYGVGESWTFIVPDFKGGGSEVISKNNKDALKDVDAAYKQNIASFSAYFGDQPFTSGPVYLGVIVCLLFILGAFTVQGPVKWGLVFITILSVMLSWGKNFMPLTDLFLDILPGYDKFRAVSMTLVIAEFTVPLLAVLAIDKMVKENDFFARFRKPVTYSIIGFIGILVIMMAAPGMFTDFYSASEFDQVTASVQGQNISSDVIQAFFDNVTIARKHIMTSDVMRSLLFALIAGALIWTYLRFKYSKEIFIYVLMALLVLDLSLVGKRYLHQENFIRKGGNEIPFPITPADQYILSDKSPSKRVLNISVNTFNDASTSYYHQSIGGYHGAKLKRYKELIDYELIPELTALRNGLQSPDSGVDVLLAKQDVLNMLNTKYIIFNPDAAPLINKSALGNAWFVNQYEIVANSDSEIAALNSFDPSTTAIVDQRYKDQLNGFQFQSDSSASIVMNQYQPDNLIYTSNATSEQLAVFSEIYYDKGWNVYVDGNPSTYFRVNYVLRGMRIPPGQHKIEWKFEPTVVKTGEKIALAGSSLLLICVAGLAFMAWRQHRSGKEA